VCPGPDATTEQQDGKPKGYNEGTFPNCPERQHAFRQIDGKKNHAKRSQGNTEVDQYLPMPAKIERYDPEESTQQSVEGGRGSGKVTDDWLVRKLAHSQRRMYGVHPCIRRRDKDQCE
jgi:hypothetical protein